MSGVTSWVRDARIWGVSLRWAIPGLAGLWGEGCHGVGSVPLGRGMPGLGGGGVSRLVRERAEAPAASPGLEAARSPPPPMQPPAPAAPKPAPGGPGSGHRTSCLCTLSSSSSSGPTAYRAGTGIAIIAKRCCCFFFLSMTVLLFF